MSEFWAHTDLLEAEGPIVLSPEESRHVTARRLREEAFLAWRADRVEEARDCLAGAEAFESGEEAGELAVTFLHATLEPLIEQLGEAPAEEEPPSLIAKP